jgi:hypothetical protein
MENCLEPLLWPINRITPASVPPSATITPNSWAKGAKTLLNKRCKRCKSSSLIKLAPPRSPPKQGGYIRLNRKPNTCVYTAATLGGKDHKLDYVFI